MCARCDGFLERKRVNSLSEYRDLARQILGIMEQGTLKELSGTRSLQETLPPRRSPSGRIVHIFGCPTCSRRFRLSVELHHGCGGAWEVITSSCSVA